MVRGYIEPERRRRGPAPGPRATLPLRFPFRSAPAVPSTGHTHWKECLRACADTNSCSCSARTLPDDKSQAVIDKSTRLIVAAGGQIIKVAPWGRRRLAYPIGHHREGSYQIVLFESPPEVLTELEHSLLITEEVIRHLVTRVERPSRAPRDGDDTDSTT